MADENKDHVSAYQDPEWVQMYSEYKAAYLAKDMLGLHSNWQLYNDYWEGNVNMPEDDDDPGCNTNIIHPIIESQVADLVDQTLEILVSGEEPSDHPFATDVKHVLEWVWNKNDMVSKLDTHERMRLKYGTAVLKVIYDRNANKGVGMPVVKVINPGNLFIDPKITDPFELDEADFVIHATKQSINSLIRRFGDKAKEVQPEPMPMYDPDFLGGADPSLVADIASNKALLLEKWTLTDKGLRLLCGAGGVKLYDSDKDDKAKDGFYKGIKRYPFIITPCYKRDNMIWGMGDIELLKPVQDLINDLDDQIIMNARLMGNLQVIVGIASGINLRKWTNKPGLKIPARDHTAIKEIQPPNIPMYIPNRREIAKNEGQELSGRLDFTEGKNPGSVRAASAIIALQEAGSKRVNHKKLMMEQGGTRLLELILDFIKEFFDVEKAYRITNSKDNSYIFFKGTALKQIPILIPGESYDIMGQQQDLVDSGETKEAEFDLKFSIGAGLPNNKSFVYQATIELHREGIITLEEARTALKQLLQWPIVDPLTPQGTFASRNLAPEILNMLNGMSGGAVPPEAGLQGAAGSEPTPTNDFTQQMLSMLGGGNTSAN